MYLNKLKRAAAIVLAGTMTMTMAGCGKKEEAADNKQSQEESTTSAKKESAGQNTDADYVDEEVTLPDDFGNMIYPLEALMVESYSKGLPYYSEDSEEGEEDSFWFSMAVLSSLMDDYVKDYSIDTDNQYLYLDEETINMYASAMYDAYGTGNLEFPELSDDDTYATYDEENEAYGFLRGDVGTLQPYITICEEDGGDYVLMTELRDSETDQVEGAYQIILTQSSYDGEENAFAYSVKDFQVLEEAGDEFDENTEEMEESTEMTTEEVMETTEETTEETEVEEETDSISQDDAMDLAQDYYGADAEYSYQGMVTVGDYEYYDFSVEGEDISSTDVLVSVSGNDVIGGVKNDDGSWSFDQ